MPRTFSDEQELTSVAVSTAGAEPPLRRSLRQALAVALLALLALGAAPPPAIAAAVERLTIQVLATWPHDPQAFTQGLVWWEGKLYESSGLYGQSTLREIDPESGRVRRERRLPAELFAEGLAAVGERLVQLTWREGVALLWGLPALERQGDLRYTGEGWGLCHDGARLVMSDGSNQLVFRDPATFAETGRVSVSLEGQPYSQLNELECADGWVWANVWQRDWIVRIDPLSGHITGLADASGLLTAAERKAVDALNGIAHSPERGSYFLTGKLWPRMFEVVFAAAATGAH